MTQETKYKQHECARLQFSPPFQCGQDQLRSILDCYSSNPQGHWPVKPKLLAPLEHYQACGRILGFHPGHETVGEYLLTSLNILDSTTRSLLEIILKEIK